MPRYLTLLKFTDQGAKNLSKSSSRAEAFLKAAGKAGVKVEAQFWTTGNYDGALILSAKDENNVLRCLAKLAAAGNVRTEALKAFDSAEFKDIMGA